MQTIRVKYMGATNTKGAYFKAISSSGLSATSPRTYAGGEHDDEWRAARKLCTKLGWSGCNRMIRGSLGKSGDESVFVFLPESCSCPAAAFQGLRKRSRRGKRSR